MYKCFYCLNGYNEYSKYHKKYICKDCYILKDPSNDKRLYKLLDNIWKHICFDCKILMIKDDKYCNKCIKNNDPSNDDELYIYKKSWELLGRVCNNCNIIRHINNEYENKNSRICLNCELERYKKRFPDIKLKILNNKLKYDRICNICKKSIYIDVFYLHNFIIFECEDCKILKK